MSRVKRLKKELEVAENYPTEGVSLLGKGPESLLGCVVGPEGTPYEGGLFYIEVTIPEDYPFKPPNLKFKTKAYHPNINLCGNVSCCIAFRCGNWSPALTIKSLLIQMRNLLSDPNSEDPLMPEIAD